MVLEGGVGRWRAFSDSRGVVAPQVVFELLGGFDVFKVMLIARFRSKFGKCSAQFPLVTFDRRLIS